MNYPSKTTNPHSRRKRLLAYLSLPTALLAPVLRADITYSLNFNPSSSPEAQQVANSVAVAASFYNQNGSFNKHWNVYYDPGIPTAQASYDGYMGFGGQRNERVVFHEAAHTFGMGTTGAYSNLISGGVWGGQHGNQAQFDTYKTYGDGLHGDGHAIWPGGFNYDNEDGFIQRHWHTRIMAGIRADMGILSFTREAKNQRVHTGKTAEFSVVSPVAATYQWQKNGVNISNGGDISGARDPVLRIANAEAADEGSYRCVVTGAGETLNSRPRQLWVAPIQQLARLALDGNATDGSGNGNNGTTFGSPVYTTGKVGQAIDLDGADDYVSLPTAAAHARDITVATWVNWDGGNAWQRVFDFGNNTHQYLFLTPSSGNGTLRLAFRDSINGVNTEYQVNAPALATGQWVHVAAVLNGSYATLYVNGKAMGTTSGIPVAPSHFVPTRNYIGKSQFADPLFNGRVDDFRIYNHALNGPDIWALWGQSANNAPAFTAASFTLPDATVGAAYSQALSAYATDADGDSLSFTKISGPSWLSIASNGALSGTPGSGQLGENVFHVRVTDPTGASSDAELRIHVAYVSNQLSLSSGTPPVGDGVQNLNFSTSTANNTNVQFVPSEYLAGDNTNKLGQSFTTGSNAGGYSLTSISVRQVSWGQTFWDYTGGNVTLRLFSMDSTSNGVWNITQLALQTEAVGGEDDGIGLSSGTPGANAQWLTITLDSPLFLAPNTQYGFLLVADGTSGNDGFFMEIDGTNTSTYAGGFALTTGDINGTTAWDGNNGQPSDRAFVAAMTAAADPPPAAPTGLAATPGDGSVDLDWADNSEPDLAGYMVHRSTTSGSGYMPVATGLAVSTYTDNTALNGTTYYYVVTAVDSGSNESAFSGEVSATPQTVNNAPQFASSLLIKSNATVSSPYSGSIAGDASDPDAGDMLTFSKVGGPTWLSVAGNGSLSGTPATGDAGTNQWTVQVTDGGGLNDTATLQITVDAPAGPTTYGANGETTVAGSIVSGSYASTLSSDNSYEQIREIESGGKPSNRYSYLEHVWSFDLGAGGSQVVLSVEAHHSANSENDDFVFAYSTDGVNYTNALTVTKTADDNVAQTATLPAGLSGVIQIRVRDTDQTQGRRALDSIHVDALGVEVTP